MRSLLIRVDVNVTPTY